MDYNTIRDIFEDRYNVQSKYMVSSPGRINIIGEHTDYNQGFVLPAAIDKRIVMAIGPNDDEMIRLYANEFNSLLEIKVADLAPVGTLWANYLLGVVAGFKDRGVKIGGFNIAFDGDVPIGSGLSSSAALECATAFALQALYETTFEKMELVKMAQRAEHVYAKVNCGIMDQFSSVFGKKDHAMRLDCRSLEYVYVPFRLDGLEVLLLNSNVKHSLSSSAYNKRREECEQGVAWVREKHPEVGSLRDVGLAMLDDLVRPKDALVYQRCRYIVRENERVLAASDDLKRGNLGALGQKMYASHEGLSKEYEVSCKELDFLVEKAGHYPEIIGARMMGGGFGGCTINLVKKEATDRIIEEMSNCYRREMDRELSAYVAQIEDGSSVIVNSNSMYKMGV